MNSNNTEKTEEGPIHVDLARLAQEESWNDIKKVRSQLTLYSMKKSMTRVLKEK